MRRWLRVILLASAGLLFLLLFSGEIRDSDVFWHLKTGQYILETGSFPVPDPFSYVSTGSSYPGEDITRRFNLTHEWLSQVFMHLTWRALGFPGLVIGRVLLLTAFCGLAGWIAFRRTRQFAISLAAALAAAGMAFYFAQSRPFLATFVFLALTMAILEARRPLWLLPAVFLIWANCHSGFILGWILCGAYSLEAFVFRKEFGPDARRLWVVSAVAILISVLNPNGIRIFQILTFYRSSGIQTTNLEWQRPIFWKLDIYSFLLFGTALALLFARRKARLVDWILYATFAAISLLAVRNTIFIGLVGPVIIATYLATCLPKWRFTGPVALAVGAAGLIAFDVAPAARAGNTLALRVATWQLPTGAANFIEAHHITARMFNNYEAGGYLIWRLWPSQQVFIDGRGLSEKAFTDYRRILYDESRGKTAMHLLDQYGIEMIVTEGFDYLSGQVYPLAVDLANASTGWKLVFADDQCLILMRNPTSTVTPLNSASALPDSLASQCAEHMQHDPLRPRCAFGLAELFAYRGDSERARQWISTYIGHRTAPDREADEIYQSLTVTDLNRQAMGLQKNGRLAEAEALLRQALAGAQQTLGSDHPDTAGAMNNLATVLESEGSYGEAESLFRRSLEICEKKFGPSDLRTAMALDNLAGVLEARGDLANAEALLRRALSIAERSPRPDDAASQVIREDLNSLLKARRSERDPK